MEVVVMMKKMFKVSLTAMLFLSGSQTLVMAQGAQPGAFGGELRGITRVKGKILCAPCTLKEAKDANPDLQSQLYEFDNGTQRAVFQVTGIGEVAGVQDANDLAWWRTITGLNKQLPVRMAAGLWKNLTAEENLLKEVELTTLLRSTSSLDVSDITFSKAE
jgi:hypothetical protein